MKLGMIMTAGIVACLMQLGAWANSAVTVAADAPTGQAFVQTDTDTELGGLTIGGTLIKQGGGTLTLRNNGFGEGTLRVDNGSAVLAAGASATTTNELPLYLRDNLVLWFDATRNVILNETDGSVDEWRDVREAEDADASSIVYTRAVRYEEEPTPVPVSALGRQALDFGEYGSGRWLAWVNPDGSQRRQGGIRTVFVVLAPPSGGMGFVMGDWTGWGNASSSGGTAPFHKETGGSANINFKIFTTGENLFAWTRGVWLDGRRVNPTTTPYATGFQLLEVITTNGVTLSNFCNDRNLKPSSTGGAVNARQGGMVLGEVLVFTRELLEQERRAVAAYLNAKWFARGSAGTVMVADGTSATADVSASDEPLKLTQLAGSGTFEKIGDGTVSLGWANELFAGAAVLSGGTLDSGSGCVSRAAPFALTAGGVSLAVADNAVEASAQVDGTAVVKTGEGVLAVTAVDAAVTRLDVADGTVRLQPAMIAATENVVIDGGAYIGNPSIETNTLGGNFSNTAQATDWITEESHKVNNGDQSSGLTKGATVWCAPAMQDGTVGVYIQRAAEAVGRLSVTHSGIYQLSFWYIGRPNRTYGDLPLAVYVDGVMAGSVTASKTDAFTQFTCMLPALQPGEHELVVKGLRDDQDRCAVVDAFSVRLLQAGTFASVPNPGFEATTFGGAQHGGFPGSYYTYNTANAGWQFSDDQAATDSGSGITEAWGTWTRLVPEGKSAAFLQRLGTMSASVVFPEAGRYKLSFQAAARRDRAGVDFAILLDNVEVGRVHPLAQAFNTFSVILPERTAGEINTLTFVGLNNDNDGVDRTAIIDQVIIEKMPAASGFSDGFEESGNAWQFENAAGRTGFVSLGQTNDVLILEGTNAALLQGASAVWRPVALGQAGAYSLSFVASGRQSVPKNTFNFAHAFDVLFGGEKVGRVTVDDDVARRYTFRLPYYAVAEAPVELRFVGIADAVSTDSFSLIDDVQIAPLATQPPETIVTAATKIEVEQDAVLELDFGGTIELDEVRFNGRLVIGLINATTQPAFVKGAGALYVSPRGTVLLLQ